MSDEPIMGMLPPPAIARVDRLRRRVDALSRVIQNAQATLDHARDFIDSINRDIGRMAAPMPDGYMHAPDCVAGRDGWHTCIPIPEVVESLVLLDLLLLVGVRVSPTVVERWTVEQRKQAAEWAGAVHIQASDNDVSIPPRPDFLPPEKWDPFA